MQWSDAIKEHVEALPSIQTNVALARRLYGLLDLTSLNDDDTEATVSTFLENATSSLGHVAAVCVYPAFVRLAAASLAGSRVRIATVANFPEGVTTLETVLIEIGRALADGAQEIDVVFPYQRYLAGEKQYAKTFIESCKAVCGDKVLLKVILETGALVDHALIADACFDVLSSGADFIKTSTGKRSEGATLDAAATMLLVIKHMEPQLKRCIGFKAAGGIRNISQAANYLALADRIMGPTWATPATFRIGASRLASELLKVTEG